MKACPYRKDFYPKLGSPEDKGEHYIPDRF